MVINGTNYWDMFHIETLREEKNLGKLSAGFEKQPLTSCRLILETDLTGFRVSVIHWGDPKLNYLRNVVKMPMISLNDTR